ncbi:hypothetical protein RND81_09G035300 [Saponaria officinalis]|uniref:PGG domain-containing protein n=1 Tax=Saponaria officinalis TaxID=3572 RepID=A0AAW1II50_SAPOF
MDPALREAVDNEDVNFLREAVALQRSEYFLTQYHKEGDTNDNGNILHLAAWSDKLVFFTEAMKILPKKLLYQLLSQKVLFNRTPLHAAALMGQNSHTMVKIILDFYASLSTDDYDDDNGVSEKPWLALSQDKRTPLYVALQGNNENEKCAMEILLMDVELLSSMVDKKGISPLFLALKNGFSQVAETILMSCSVSLLCVGGEDGSTPLHFAPNCSENVLRLLLEKCGDCIDTIDNNGYTVLHQWAEIGKEWPCKLLLDSSEFHQARTKIFKHLIFSEENKLRDTPLYIAARNKDSKLAQILVEGYRQITSDDIEEIQVSVECHPWRIKNKFGNTALHTALYSNTRNEEFAVKLLSIDLTLCRVRNNKGESPFFLAVKTGCEEAVDVMLRYDETCFDMLRRNDGESVLHCLSSCPEKTGIRVLEKYWWMINLVDDNKKTALDKAKETNKLWLILACKNDEMQAVLAFIDQCQDLQRACHEENDTPLHHIKLPTYKDYLNLLKIPSIGELKNATDHDGATPLHRALERKDMLLARILLLDDGVERMVSDHNGVTAMDLLAKLCNENDDWDKMCKQIKVNPYMKTSYIRSGTNLDQIRNTLSVVAALLATITFAAGFTLPGGINANNGEALLAKKPAFLVFLLADVYAMCTSMLVLFCLIWSMVSEPDMARLLVDRSVYILMQSLYSTLLAFMTGIFTVIWHSSLWAAIVVFVMCSVVGIAANRTILRNVLAKFIPAVHAVKQDQMQLLEEGNMGASSMKNDISLRFG